MASTQWWQEEQVLSHWNYSSFRFWLAEVATPTERELVLKEVFLTLHRVAPCFDEGEVVIGNGNYDLRQVFCQKETCPRCEQGVGGYVFNWISPKWTAVEFIPDAGLTIQENKGRASTAFHTAVSAANYTGGKIYDHLTLIPAKLGGADVTSAGGAASSSA